MRGKLKCQILKTIRKRIATMNGIEYNPEECTFEGECKGTCPKCEEESSMLMHELRTREKQGFNVNVDAGTLMDLNSIALTEIENLDDDDDDTKKDDYYLGDCDYFILNDFLDENGNPKNLG